MENTFSVIENGIEVKYTVIKLCKYNNNNYIIYKDDKGECYSSKYTLENNKVILDEITTKDEWNFIDKCLGEENE